MKNIRYYLLTISFMLMLMPAQYGCATARATGASQTGIATADGSDIEKNQETTTVNIMSLGADNTGRKDCSDLVRKAQQKGNVYFPQGTYLMGPVDVMPNRKYYGDGIGKTIIKAKHTNIKMLWGISTYDFDKSGHPQRNIENVEISDMTLDYNLTAGWVDYYSMIIFKGRKAHSIRNIKIQHIEFIDNAKRVHPDVTGGNGKDSWSVNLSSFAGKTEDIIVDKCISNAESHQFVGGGGSWLKRVSVTNNYIKNPHANGIAFTTISEDDVTFDDFTVIGNTIIDPFGSAILFGHDPGTAKRDGGYQTFTNLLVANNKISFGDYTVYGKSYRTKKSFPYVINLSGAEPYMKGVTIKNNDITVNDDYNGGDIAFGKIRSYTFKRTPFKTLQAFKQPAVNSAIELAIPAGIQNSRQFTGSFIKINAGGIYEISKVTSQSITLKLTNWDVKAQPGSTVPEGSQVGFIGGKLEDVKFLDNRVTGKKTLRVIPGGLINMLTFKGNNKIAFTMPYANNIIDNAELNNNTDFSFSQSEGQINGVMSGNKRLKQKAPVKKLAKTTNAVLGNDVQVKNNLRVFDND